VEGRKSYMCPAKKYMTKKRKNNTKGIPFATIDQRVIIPPSRFLLVGEKKWSKKKLCGEEEK